MSAARYIFSTLCILWASGSISANAADFNDNINKLSTVLTAEVKVQEGIAAEEVSPIPDGAEQMPPREVMQRCMKNYSYAMVYEGDDVVGVWVYQSGHKTYKTVTAARKPRDGLPAPLIRPAQHTVISKTSAEAINQSNNNSSTILPSNKWYQTNNNKNAQTNSSGFAFKENSFGFKIPSFSPVSNKNTHYNASQNFTGFDPATPHQSQSSNSANMAMINTLRMRATINKR